jgi:hypothetical protein
LTIGTRVGDGPSTRRRDCRPNGTMCLGIQVPRQFHGVLQKPADDNPVAPG